MKKMLIRSGYLLLVLAMTFSSVLAQEGESADAATNDPGPGIMILILAIGLVIVFVLGFAMNAQQSSEQRDE